MQDWKKKLPMQLTLSRIYVLPLILWCLYVSSFWSDLLAALIFVLASITDYYDGYFARKYNAVSNMGKFMDPIADKILVTSILTVMILSNKVDPYMVILLSVRDTFIGGIRSVAAADQVIIAAKTAGKWKTGLQMVAIPTTIIGEHIPFIYPLQKIGCGILWISVILSITSGIDYYLSYKRAVKG